MTGAKEISKIKKRAEPASTPTLHNANMIAEAGKFGAISYNNIKKNIFAGHYGSGKTRLAVNFAVKLKDSLADKSFKIAAIDLDTVNPYFRTKDYEDVFKREDIKLYSPLFANTNLDIPAISPDILAVFQQEKIISVFDVGGDGDGAIALGQYNRYFTNEPYEMFLVVNLKRPLTNTAEDIISMISEIETASRLTVTALINNTNLSYLTSVDHILNSHPIVELAAQRAGIKKVYLSAKADIAEQLPDEYKNNTIILNI